MKLKKRLKLINMSMVMLENRNLQLFAMVKGLCKVIPELHGKVDGNTAELMEQLDRMEKKFDALHGDPEPAPPEKPVRKKKK